VSARPTSVFVVHPEAMSAEAIAVALARYPGLVPVGIATTAAEGQRLGARADAIVIHQLVPGARICVRRLLEQGVRVVVLGGLASVDGELLVSTSSSIDQLASTLTPAAEPSDTRVPTLTQRERQVLTLVAGGFAGKQVARQLGISPKTVERHKTRIYSKLGVPNQAAAVGLALRHHHGDGEVAWT